MISCLSLGPMVTGEIWRAGPIRKDWPLEGCQVGIFFHNKHISLLVLWQGYSLTHKILLIKSSVYKWISPPSLSHPPRRKMKIFCRIRRPMDSKFHCTGQRGYKVAGGKEKSTVLLLAKESNSLVKIKSNLSGGQKLSLKMYFLRVPRIHWCGSRVLDVWGLTSIYRSDLNPNDTISSTVATLCPQSGLGAGVFQVQHITDCVTNASLIFAPQLEAAPWRAGTVTFHPSSDTTLDVA